MDKLEKLPTFDVDMPGTIEGVGLIYFPDIERNSTKQHDIAFTLLVAQTYGVQFERTLFNGKDEEEVEEETMYDRDGTNRITERDFKGDYFGGYGFWYTL